MADSDNMFFFISLLIRGGELQATSPLIVSLWYFLTKMVKLLISVALCRSNDINESQIYKTTINIIKI